MTFFDPRLYAAYLAHALIFSSDLAEAVSFVMDLIALIGGAL